MGSKLPHRAEKVDVVAQVWRHTSFSCHLAQGLQDPPIARCGQHQLDGSPPLNGLCLCIDQCAGGVGFVQLQVVQRNALGPERLRKVAHSTQENGNTLFGRPYVGGFFRHFRHPHHILRGIEVLEGGGLFIQLVAQNDDEIPY
jgi:hypothetical protein